MSVTTGFDEAIQRGVQANADTVAQREKVKEIFRDAADSVSKYLGKRSELRVVKCEQKRRVLILDTCEDVYDVCDFEEMSLGVFPIRLSYAKAVVTAHDETSLRAAFIEMLSSPHFGRILLKIKGP